MKNAQLITYTSKYQMYLKNGELLWRWTTQTEVVSLLGDHLIQTTNYFNCHLCFLCIKFPGNFVTGIKWCRFHSLLQANMWRLQLDNGKQFHADFHLDFKWSRTFLASSGKYSHCINYPTVSLSVYSFTDHFRFQCVGQETVFICFRGSIFFIFISKSNFLLLSAI